MLIGIEPDSYGHELRISYLADLLEVSAFKYGTSMSKADLADMICDNSWSRILQPIFTGGEECYCNDDSVESAVVASERVFNLLRQRASILTPSNYPFLVGDRVNYDQVENNEGSYLWLLFASFCQGSKIVTVPKVSELFEIISSEALNEKGLPITNIGTSFFQGAFSGRLSAITNAYPSLVATPHEAIVSNHANDAGVDFLGMFSTLNDKRQGQWIMIGQATVGKSGSWAKKIREPNPDKWRKLFGERVFAIPFFTTPHHIPNDYFKSLGQDYPDVAIYDRLRLVSNVTMFEGSLPILRAAIEGLSIEGVNDYVA